LISINPKTLKELKIYKILGANSMEKNIKYKKNKEINLLEEKKIACNRNYLSYNQLYLPINSIEFALTGINECLKKNFENNQFLNQDFGLTQVIEKYYFKNLILSNEDLHDEPIYLLNFEDKRNLKYRPKNLQIKEELSKEFCLIIEEKFKKKFNNEYSFEILSINKDSRELLINSNVPKEIFANFVEFINENAEKYVGAAKQLKEQKCIQEIKFSADMIDPAGNNDFTNKGLSLIRGSMAYHQPKGWMRIGLKVTGRFGNNEDWIAKNGNPNEWAVGFHGFKSVEKAMLPIKGNLISLEKWSHSCKHYENMNPRTRSKYEKCGIGVYFADKIEVCEINNFTGSCRIGNKTVKLAFQCRLNPEEIRITDFPPSLAYIVPNKSNSDYSSIRPYGILLKIEED